MVHAESFAICFITKKGKRLYIFLLTDSRGMTRFRFEPALALATIHLWANSKWEIGQSERAVLYSCYVINIYFYFRFIHASMGMFKNQHCHLPTTMVCHSERGPTFDVKARTAISYSFNGCKSKRVTCVKGELMFSFVSS